MQNAGAPNNVECTCCKRGKLQWSANEIDEIGNSVDASLFDSRLDALRRDIQPGHTGAKPGQESTVQPVSATNIENAFACQITEHVEAVLSGEPKPERRLIAGDCDGSNRRRRLGGSRQPVEKRSLRLPPP